MTKQIKLHRNCIKIALGQKVAILKILELHAEPWAKDPSLNCNFFLQSVAIFFSFQIQLGQNAYEWQRESVRENEREREREVKRERKKSFIMQINDKYSMINYIFSLNFTYKLLFIGLNDLKQICFVEGWNMIWMDLKWKTYLQFDCFNTIEDW